LIVFNTLQLTKSTIAQEEIIMKVSLKLHVTINFVPKKPQKKKC